MAEREPLLRLDRYLAIAIVRSSTITLPGVTAGSDYRLAATALLPRGHTLGGAGHSLDGIEGDGLDEFVAGGDGGV